MEQLHKLREAVRDAEQILEDAKDELKAYLQPIVKAATGHPIRGGVSDIALHYQEVHIEVEWFTSGGRYTVTHKIPQAVFAAEDAQAAAAAHKVDLEQAKKDREYNDTIRDIAALQTKLKSLTSAAP